MHLTDKFLTDDREAAKRAPFGLAQAVSSEGRRLQRFHRKDLGERKGKIRFRYLFLTPES